MKLKKYLKKILCLSLVAIIALFAVGCGGNENDLSGNKSKLESQSVNKTSDGVAKPEDYMTLTVENDKSVEIANSQNADIKVADIPTEFNGEKVVAISDNAFNNYKNLEEVIVPGTVEKIGELSFALNHNLKKVTLNEGVKEIGMKCFSQDTALVEVSLPSTLKTITSYAFVYCPSLEKITIPDGVKNIELGAFARCEKLNEVHIPKSVTIIQQVNSDIDSAVFEESPNVTIYAPKGSYAEKYAKQENIKFVAE